MTTLEIDRAAMSAGPIGMDAAAATAVRTVAGPIYAGVFLVGAATLAIEVTLTRIFSFSIWYHFAYLAINAALLGFCSSGVLGSVFPGVIQRGGPRLLCGASLLSAFLLALFLLYCAGHPLEPDEVFAHPWRFARELGLYYIAVAAPFFFAGAAIVASLALLPGALSRVYFADLAGAGTGALLSLGVMWYFGPPAAAFLCVALLVLAAGAFAHALGKPLQYALLVTGALLIPGAILLAQRVEFVPAKSTLVGVFESQPPGDMQRLFSRWNAISRVDVYAEHNPASRWSFPQWSYDGRSDRYAIGDDNKPVFYHMAYDAHNRSDIYRFLPGSHDLDFLDHHLLKTPYLVLKSAPRVLVMGSGGGIDVLNAYRNGASSIVAVELQPAVAELLKGPLVPFTHGLYAHEPKVRLVAQEGRNFLKQDTGKYDLIQFVATDTWAAQNTGAYVLTESYLYSQEAISEYLDHLDRDGILCLIVWDSIKDEEPLQQPINSKLLLQYLEVMEARGISAPGQHLAILGKREYYGNMFTVPLLKMSPFTDEEMERLRSFAADMGFQVLYDPLRATPRNVLNRLITTAPQERRALLDRALYRIEPTTDDNPFFFYIFRWSRIFGIDASNWSQPMTGQLVLLVMLAQSAVFGIAAMLVPLLVRRPAARRGAAGGSSWRFLGYFFCLGLGFMLIEVAMIQKFIVLLGYPAYAFATIMFSLLMSSGIGSYLSARTRTQTVLFKCAAVLALLLIAYNLLLPRVFAAVLGFPLGVRILTASVLQVPLGLVLGMFMPLGLAKVARYDAGLIPWAWAVNGVGSVVSTVLAIILAMSFGFRVVIDVALLVYVLGTVLLLVGQAGQAAPQGTPAR